MEVFQILGRIVVEGIQEATKALEGISNVAKKVGNTMGAGLENGETAVSDLAEQTVDGGKEATKALENVGNVAKKTGNAMDGGLGNGEIAVSSLTTTIKDLKSKVDEYRKTGLSTSDAWKKATQDMRKDTEDSASGIENAFKKIGSAVAAFVTVDTIKNFGAACIQAAADAGAMASQFQQVFGDFENRASDSLEEIADNAGVAVNRLKGSYTKIAAFAKTTGMETEDALSLADRAMVAVADSAAFYDRTLEETTESLQSFLKGNYENDSALGLSCTETTRNAAANALYGKSFNDLSEAQKQLTLLQMVEDANKASGALGQAARESDTWSNQTGNLKQAWTDFTAVIGEKFLPIAIKVVKAVSDTVNWMTEHQTAVTVLAIGVGTLTAAITAYQIAQTLATTGMTLATVAGTAFGTVMAFITSPITLVTLGIGALIAIVVLLAKNWDKIKVKTKEVWDGIWGAIKGVINKIIGGVENMVNKVIGGINGLLSGIGSVVSAVGDVLGLSWSINLIPEVNLPRLEKGGILEKGQIGLLEGNGAEAVVPLERNKKWISAVAADMNAAIGGDNEKLQKIIDLLEILIAMFPEAMVKAFETMKFKINNREFARMVREYA